MCNCRSYNWEIGEKPEVVLTPPPCLGITRCDGEPKEKISIDACIANVIGHLWHNGIITLGCCCGHDKLDPSIILEQSSTTEFAEKVRAIIAEVDDRYFQLLAWNLVDLRRVNNNA